MNILDRLYPDLAKDDDYIIEIDGYYNKLNRIELWRYRTIKRYKHLFYNISEIQNAETLYEIELHIKRNATKVGNTLKIFGKTLKNWVANSIYEGSLEEYFDTRISYRCNFKLSNPRTEYMKRYNNFVSYLDSLEGNKYFVTFMFLDEDYKYDIKFLNQKLNSLYKRCYRNEKNLTFAYALGYEKEVGYHAHLVLNTETYNILYTFCANKNNKLYPIASNPKKEISEIVKCIHHGVGSYIKLFRYGRKQYLLDEKGREVKQYYAYSHSKRR